MNRGTRDKFAASTDQTDLLYGPQACLETPPDLFARLHDEFKFDIDLFANEKNHLLPVWFGPGSPIANGTDALFQPWYFQPTSQQYGLHFPRTTCGFANPPYGAFVTLALEKAVKEAYNGFTSVFLLPMRCGSWYTQQILPYYADLRHIPRVKFWYQGKPKLTLNTKTQKWEHMTALFDSIVVVYKPLPKGQINIPFGPRPRAWDWRKV